MAIHNFAFSTVKLFFNQNTTASVYSKVVDSVSTAVTPDTEKDGLTTIAPKTTDISNDFASAYSYSAPVSGNYVSVGGRNIYLEYKEPDGPTLIVPDNYAAYYGRLIYGHNIPGVFAYLNHISEGETVTVSLNGNTQTYRVVAKITEYNDNINMRSLIFTKSYAFTMMTCVGDGATQRDIIYLN